MAEGKYIVIEGGDGTGKSTQVELLKERLAQHHIQSIVIHEPDGFEGNETLGIPSVPKATELRKKIKDATIPRTPMENVEWFTEARRLNWTSAMEPALKLGIWVLAARNWYSTITYQGYGEGMSSETIENITREQLGEAYLRPDLALILSVYDESIRQERIANRGALEKPDTFESKPATFQKAMQDGYLQLASHYGIEILDASRSIEEIQDDIWQRIETLIKESGNETIS
ncbi:MAG TPA: dTMP kinase [Candidatus Saccharibacteria bacterium]|nr:dTMP kinase [Candidatus Saccharibacteria bacterium]